MEKLSFSVKLKLVPVEIEDIDGVTKQFTLRELNGQQRDSFFNSMGKKINIVNGQPQGLKNYDGFQSSLLCMCLLDENDELVSKEKLQAFPAHVLNELWKAAQKLSGIEDEKADEIKND